MKTHQKLMKLLTITLFSALLLGIIFVVAGSSKPNMAAATAFSAKGASDVEPAVLTSSVGSNSPNPDPPGEPVRLVSTHRATVRDVARDESLAAVSGTTRAKDSRAQQAIIIDHTCTDLSKIPEYWIEQAKAQLRLSYGHTSHGSQPISGMGVLRDDPSYGGLYDFNTSGAIEVGVLSLDDRTPSGDLGHNGDTSWADRTRTYLDGSGTGSSRNVVVWSWCGGAGDNTEEGIDAYLAAMNQLEVDYPNVTFVYMTGHLEGTGVDGNLNVRNDQIRDYCMANNKVLYDFADIESYDPDGNYYLDRGADDDCSYDGGNWADEWCAAHSGDPLCESCSCSHSRPLNCNLKARVFWWMLARLAGWADAADWISVTAVTDVASIYPGETATYTLSVTASEGLTDPATLTLQGEPSAATVSFDPNPVTPPGASQLDITTAASTATGTYLMTVTGTAGQVTDTAPLTLIVTEPTLTLSAEPGVRTVTAGNTATYTLSVTASEGLTDPATLTLQGAPSGATVSFDPNPVTPPGASQLDITTTASTAAGTYLMTVTGTAGQVTDTVPLTLIITEPTLTLSAEPDVHTVTAGNIATYTLSVTASEGLTDPATLTLQGEPSGTTISFDPNPVTPPGASQLYITTTISTVAGTYAMTVTGTAGQVTDTTPLTLTIDHPTLTLSAEPDVRTVTAGNTATYTLSVTASEGFADPATLTLQGEPSGTTISFDPNPVTPPGASQLRITTTTSTVAGTYAMTATASSGALTDTANLTLIVASETSSFTLSISPTTRIAKPNQMVSYTATVTGVNGFSQPVTLTLVGLPTDIGTAWSVNPVTPDNSSILTLSIPSSPPFGNHPLQVVAIADTQVVAEGIRLIITYPFKMYLPIILK